MDSETEGKTEGKTEKAEERAGISRDFGALEDTKKEDAKGEILKAA